MDANTRHLTRTADDLDSRTRALAARVRSEASGLTVAHPDCDEHGSYTCPMGGTVFHCAGCMTKTGRVTLPWEERLALAAYAGSLEARELCDPADVVGDRHAMKTYATLDDSSFGYWLNGLARYPEEVLIRAAVASAVAALPVWSKPCVSALSRSASAMPECRHGARSAKGCIDAIQEARRAIEAARAWLACPCEDHREACRRIFLGGSHPPTMFTLLCGLAAGLVSEKVATMIPGDAARETSEESVRAAICEALVEWAL